MIAQILASLALIQAAPTPASRHELQYISKRDLQQPFFYPEVVTKDFPAPTAGLRLADSDAVSLGVTELAKELNLPESELQVSHSYRDAAGVMHVFASRLLNGQPVDNHNAAIHIKDGQVVYLTSSIPKSANRLASASPVATLSLDEAVKIATKELGLPRDDHAAKTVYIQLPSGSLAFAHQFQLRDDAKQRWVQVSVDAHNGQVIQVVDYVNEASYTVIALPKVSALDGFSKVVDPANAKASPKGWHSDGTTSYTVTQGNNIDSHIGSYRTSGGASLDFNPVWDATKEPTVQANKDAAIVNNFYLTNMMHDISY
ncbi:hypothetical protein HDU91_003127, partial [Kappamyces sp. JEL0680]